MSGQAQHIPPAGDVHFKHLVAGISQPAIKPFHIGSPFANSVIGHNLDPDHVAADPLNSRPVCDDTNTHHSCSLVLGEGTVFNGVFLRKPQGGWSTLNDQTSPKWGTA